MWIQALPALSGRAALVGCIALLAGVAGPVAGQHPQSARIDSIRHIQSVEPLSGPPGTTVRIYSENMPLQAHIVVGVGAMASGFEEIGVARQQEFGEVSATVRLPQSLSWERPVYLILFNGVFSPIGLSDPFHVTNAEGMVRRTGELQAGEASCLTLTDRDQVSYGLAGNLGGIEPGAEVVLDGRLYRNETCGQGYTIDVVRVRRTGE